MFGFNLSAIIYGVVVASFVAMSAVIKFQHNDITKLEIELSIKEQSIDRLELSIKEQNAALKIGEEKFMLIQRSFDIASGKNQALTKEYSLLRDSWTNTPIPKDCTSAVVELQARATEISDSWNKK